MQETGLLEQTVLLIGPLNCEGGRELLAGWGQPVGFVRPREQAWRLWWSWLSWRSLSVHEHDDEPLLFTVRRKWPILAARRVLDAEEEPVGTISFPWLLDRWNQPIVKTQPQAPGKGVFLSVSGKMLAEWSPQESSVRFEILDAARHDPFLKMLLLAALLEALTARRGT